MKLLGKILTSIFGVLIPIALVGVICYLAIPGFKTKVDDTFKKPETEIEQEKEPEVDAGTEDEKEPTEDEGNEPSTDKTGSENEGTGEGEQIPETPATVSFVNNTISIEV